MRGNEDGLMLTEYMHRIALPVTRTYQLPEVPISMLTLGYINIVFSIFQSGVQSRVQLEFWGVLPFLTKYSQWLVHKVPLGIWETLEYHWERRKCNSLFLCTQEKHLQAHMLSNNTIHTREPLYLIIPAKHAHDNPDKDALYISYCYL